MRDRFNSAFVVVMLDHDGKIMRTFGPLPTRSKAASYRLTLMREAQKGAFDRTFKVTAIWEPIPAKEIR